MIDGILSFLVKYGQSHRMGPVLLPACCLLGTQGWHRLLGGSELVPTCLPGFRLLCHSSAQGTFVSLRWPRTSSQPCAVGPARQLLSQGQESFHHECPLLRPTSWSALCGCDFGECLRAGHG